MAILGLLTTTMVVVTFKGVDYTLLTDTPPVKPYERISIPADGSPILTPGHQAEEKQAINAATQTFEGALASYLGTVGRVSRRTSPSVGRINIQGYSRCAMGIPHFFGRTWVITNHIKEQLYKKNFLSDWGRDYYRRIMNGSVDFFLMTLEAISASKGRYTLETWPIKFVGQCTIFDEFDQNGDWKDPRLN